MYFTINTFGCKVNQYDGEVLKRLMTEAGFQETTLPELADIFILNSCTVTENGDKKALHEAGRIRRQNPNAVIVLTGCYPQAFPDKATEITAADIITGTADRTKIPEKIKAFLDEKSRIIALGANPACYEETAVPTETDKTRAFVKIEDGCDRFCSYCIIPYARGRVRSRLPEKIRREIDIQCEAGHKEIVLVGINLSCYGKELGLTLADAGEIAAENPLVERVRLSSLEPELLTKEQIGRLASVKKLCPHFHLSLQSGCDETLRRMNRHYTAAEYAEIVQNLREVFPNCAVTTDIMVGFAGETDEEFNRSMAFAKEIGFAKIHVFTYSVREGTAAAKRTDHIEPDIKNRRYKEMSALADELRCEFLRKQIGTVQRVLVEKRTSPDFINGYTENYTPVRIYGSNASRHELISVEITEATGNYCLGKQL